MKDNSGLHDQSGIDIVAMVRNRWIWYSLNLVPIELAGRLDVGSEGKQGVKN